MQAEKPLYLSPIPYAWRVVEAAILVFLYLFSLGWGDFGSSRPMIQDTMMFGAHLFASVEDSNLCCQRKLGTNTETRLADNAQLRRSRLLAAVAMATDIAATVTQIQHVVDDNDETLYATLTTFLVLMVGLSTGRVYWFFSQKFNSKSSSGYTPRPGYSGISPVVSARTVPIVTSSRTPQVGST